MTSIRDQEIAGRILHALTLDPRVHAADRILVRVESGVVTLTGTLHSATEKAVAGEIAARVPGVRTVENAITIAGPPYRESDELAHAVEQALAAAGFDLSRLGVRVVGRRVTLVGWLPDWDSLKRALEVAGSVFGVREVRSDVALGEVAPEVARELLAPIETTGAGAVDAALLKSRVLEAIGDAGIVLFEPRVQVVDRTVYLEGHVRTEAERQRAEQIARQVDGVRRVINRLIVELEATSTDPDELLAVQVLEALRRSGQASPTAVHVNAVRGTVYLHGEVDSLEQSLAAERIARQVPGVVDVVNNLLVATRTATRSEDKGLVRRLRQRR
jgi:osmotically-inducible protein OsmY